MQPRVYGMLKFWTSQARTSLTFPQAKMFWSFSACSRPRDATFPILSVCAETILDLKNSISSQVVFIWERTWLWMEAKRAPRFSQEAFALTCLELTKPLESFVWSSVCDSQGFFRASSQVAGPSKTRRQKVSKRVQPSGHAPTSLARKMSERR